MKPAAKQPLKAAAKYGDRTIWVLWACLGKGGMASGGAPMHSCPRLAQVVYSFGGAALAAVPAVPQKH